MARYDFVCGTCGYKDEKILLMKNRNAPQECPQCKCIMVRQVGCPGFKFVGTGFYENDYKKPKDIKKQAIKEKKRRKEGKSGYTEI